MLHLFFHELTPPAFKLDADLEFVFRVAFAASGESFTPPQSGDGAWRCARQLGLDYRIAEHLTADQAQELLGSTRGRALEVLRQQLAANKLAREEVYQQLVAAVEDCGVEVVLLRRAALGRAGEPFWKTSMFGSEGVITDILVNDSDIEKLSMALINAGCSVRLEGKDLLQSAVAQRRTAVFLGQRGAAIVLHPQLRFVRMVPGGVFVDLACLKRCGLLLRDDVTKSKGIWIPSEAVQAADWTAQALVEQRFAPEYPRVSAWLDAQTLGLHQNEDLAFDAYLMLQTDVEYAEFEALRELLRALGKGELTGLSKRARTLLNHAIAAATSPAYRAKLRLQSRAQVWQHEGHLERAAEGLGRLIRVISRK